jgi:hypothetical protein
MEAKHFKSKYQTLNLLGQGSFGNDCLIQEAYIELRPKMDQKTQNIMLPKRFFSKDFPKKNSTSPMERYLEIDEDSNIRKD